MTRDERQNWENRLPLAEYWYNASYHSSVKLSHFEALYGYSPPIIVPYFARDSKNEAMDRMLLEREDMNCTLKKKIKLAQKRMNSRADKRR